VFLCLFSGILSASGGVCHQRGTVSLAIIAALDSGGYLIHQAIDKSSAEYSALADESERRYIRVPISRLTPE
jgi:hypothetical protein